MSTLIRAKPWCYIKQWLRESLFILSSPPVKSQQTWNFATILSEVYYWASIAYDGPTLTQHWVNVSCFLFYDCCWCNVKTTHVLHRRYNFQVLESTLQKFDIKNDLFWFRLCTALEIATFGDMWKIIEASTKKRFFHIISGERWLVIWVFLSLLWYRLTGPCTLVLIAHHIYISCSRSSGLGVSD